MTHNWKNVSDYVMDDLVDLSFSTDSITLGQVPIAGFDDNFVRKDLQIICRDLNKALQKR